VDLFAVLLDNVERQMGMSEAALERSEKLYIAASRTMGAAQDRLARSFQARQVQRASEAVESLDASRVTRVQRQQDQGEWSTYH
jgi:hypothetical protein